MTVKWTAEDNRIAETEEKLAEILTEELNARPEVSMRLMFASRKVQARIEPILKALIKDVGRPLKADAEQWFNGRKRRVIVTIT